MTSCENDQKESSQLEKLRLAHMFTPAKNDVRPTSARPPPHLFLSRVDKHGLGIGVRGGGGV